MRSTENGDVMELVIRELHPHNRRRDSAWNWPVQYASIIESEGIPRILSTLCDAIDATTDAPAPDREAPTRGEAIFGAVMMISAGRHAPWWLNECASRGYLSRVWDYRTFLAALEDPTTAEILVRLIEAVAEPFAEIENRAGQFAIGSSFVQGAEPTLHLMIGTATQVVTSARVSHLAGFVDVPDLLAATAKRFAVRDVSADSCYFSHVTLEAIDAIGAVPFIAPRRNCGIVGKSTCMRRALARCLSDPEDFRRRVQRDRFYVQRTLAAIAVLAEGGSVRSKLPAARANERLVSVLLYNLRCLCRAKERGIEDLAELGIEPKYSDYDVIGKLPDFGSTQPPLSTDAEAPRNEVE